MIALTTDLFTVCPESFGRLTTNEINTRLRPLERMLQATLKKRWRVLIGVGADPCVCPNLSIGRGNCFAVYVVA